MILGPRASSVSPGHIHVRVSGDQNTRSNSAHYNGLGISATSLAMRSFVGQGSLRSARSECAQARASSVSRDALPCVLRTSDDAHNFKALNGCRRATRTPGAFTSDALKTHGHRRSCGARRVTRTDGSKMA